MPKLKTNSSTKKRLKVTGTGKIKFKQTRKRHGMTKRSGSKIRDSRKSGVLSEANTPGTLKFHMPYSR